MGEIDGLAQPMGKLDGLASKKPRRRPRSGLLRGRVSGRVLVRTVWRPAGAVWVQKFFIPTSRIKIKSFPLSG